MMFCSQCGQPLEANTAYCKFCGKAQFQQPQPLTIPAKKPKTYGALALVMSITAGVLLIALILSLVLPMFSKGAGGNDPVVNKAIGALEEKWTGLYRESGIGDGYLEIVHTRVAKIDPDENDVFFQELENGTEIEYVVEFTLLSDYYGAAPYYHNVGVYDTVLVYRDGSTLVAGNFFQMYRSLTYNSDYSAFLVELRDMGSQYNRVMDLK